MHLTHLPYDAVVDGVLFFVLLLLQWIIFTEKITPIFLTQNKNKNIDEICAKIYGT